MRREQQVLLRLQAIEQLLHDKGLWQSTPPESEAFNSVEPFCVDTMMPLQWLQWIFLPRMHALIDADADLPVKLALAPYYEMALDADMPERTSLLYVLVALDDLFEHDA